VRVARTNSPAPDYSLPRYSGGGLGWGFCRENEMLSVVGAEPPPEPSPGVPGEGEMRGGGE